METEEDNVRTSNPANASDDELRRTAISSSDLKTVQGDI
jgi:hypothetical protein